VNEGVVYVHTPTSKSVSVVGDKVFKVRVCVPESTFWS